MKSLQLSLIPLSLRAKQPGNGYGSRSGRSTWSLILLVVLMSGLLMGCSTFSAIQATDPRLTAAPEDPQLRGPTHRDIAALARELQEVREDCDCRMAAIRGDTQRVAECAAE